MTKTQVEAPKSYFGATYSIPPEKDEQKIAEQEVLGKMAQEKPKPTHFGEIPTANPEMDEQKIADKEVLEKMEQEKTKATSFGELPTVSAENSETNINANDPEVQGLIQAKQKNALRAASSKRSQERYQDIKERLTYRFADEHNIDDV